jgi:hypothetical protein
MTFPLKVKKRTSGATKKATEAKANSVKQQMPFKKK